jgi:hypothetical protein
MFSERMEDSKTGSASAAPTPEEPRDEAISKDESQHQDDVKDNNTSHHESEQGDTIENEKGELITEEITTTKSQSAESVGKDYSSFSAWQKRFIVFAATMGAFFSPFTTQIYFPALTSIAKDLNVTNSQINLTMTTYMVRYPYHFLVSLAKQVIRYYKQ